MSPTASPGATAIETSVSASTSCGSVRPRSTNNSFRLRASFMRTRKRRETPVDLGSGPFSPFIDGTAAARRTSPGEHLDESRLVVRQRGSLEHDPELRGVLERPRCRGHSGSPGGRPRTRSDKRRRRGRRWPPARSGVRRCRGRAKARRSATRSGRENVHSWTPARSATRRAVSSSSSRYGSPSSRIREGSECAVKTTCLLLEATRRSASNSTRPGSVTPALDEADRGATVHGLFELRPGSGRSTSPSSGVRGQAPRARPAPPSRARARPRRRSSAASGACPVKTGSPSSASSVARVGLGDLVEWVRLLDPEHGGSGRPDLRGASGTISKPPRMSA